MGFGDVRTRPFYGLYTFAAATVDSDAYVALDVEDASGVTGAVLGGLTIVNKTASAVDPDPQPKIRVALTEAALDAATVTIEPDGDSLPLGFDPAQRVTKVWIKGTVDNVSYEVIYEWERGPNA